MPHVRELVRLCLQVNVEVALTARYWTKLFVLFTVLSYVCAYLFMLVYMWIVVAGNQYDPAQYGVVYRIIADANLWLLQVPTLDPALDSLRTTGSSAT